MADAAWAPPEKRRLIGQRISRADGPPKATGAAKYAYDIQRPGLTYAKCLGAKHASAVVKAIDTSAAESAPGVRAVWVDENVLNPDTPFKVEYAGQILAAVAADTEEQAAEAVRKLKVEYEVQEHNVDDADKARVTDDEPEVEETEGVDQAFQDAAKVSEGHYGIAVIAHCCLEPHGQTCEVGGGEIHVWPSTQNVSRYTGGLGYTANVPESKIHVDCQYMGGGFGSKFGSDKWGDIGIYLSEKAGRPVKLLLDRDLELMVAGNRPSYFADIRVAANAEGDITAWESTVWGSSGPGNHGVPPLPYIFTRIPETRITGMGIRTNRGPTRAWRAPNHPQACLLTMAALDDLAARIGMDPIEFFQRNAVLTDRADVYREQLDIAAQLIGYWDKVHPRGESGSGPIKRGLGVSMHTWGGRGHNADCDVTLNPDGSVDVKIGTQDLGTGTRTVIDIVVAETLGLPLDQVAVNIGRNAYPAAGASGGSTTVGGVSGAARLAATDALNALLEVVAPKLGVQPDKLEAADGQIREIDNPSNAIPWGKACGLLGQSPITRRGNFTSADGARSGLIDSGVGGVQIADVSVDVETGVVRINEMVAVQDCGLIIDMKTAESQVYGGLIMGITYALCEECIYDPVTGRMLNDNMVFYKLAGLPDVGTLKVHLMTEEKYQQRGVIGLGEPPVISPGAAISNAVANAIGVRVPYLPLTPDRVLAALAGGGNQA